MKACKDYIVQFAALSIGEHEYTFEIGDTFFENLEHSEIKQAAIKVDLTLLKQSTMMILQFHITGTVKANCDICTDQFDLPLDGTYKLIVKVGGHETGNEDDDIITIAANEFQLDLGQYLYEYIALSLPIRRIHSTDEKETATCDKAILKKLKDYLIAKEPTDPADPRWNDLKNIKLN